jgi:polyketide biosynthesis enoyl-CoA hydratase PksI
LLRRRACNKTSFKYRRKTFSILTGIAGGSVQATIMNNPVDVTTRSNGISCLALNDAEHKNAFTGKLVDAFIEGLDRLKKEAATKVLIIQGLPEVFCAGADKESLLALCSGDVRAKDLLLPEHLLDSPFPVIAAMEGHAVGGGLLLAVCCDIVIAAKESRYGASFLSMGFTPGMGCTKLLEGLVGPYIAAEMMYTGRMIKGSELAEKAVNFNYIVPKAEVLIKANDIAQRICENNSDSISLLKHALSAPRKKLLAAAREQEDLMHRITFSSPQTKKAIKDLYPDPEKDPL